MTAHVDVTPERRAEVARVIAAVEWWARERQEIRAVALVGSWARGEATMASDVDLVILTDAAGFEDPDWWSFVGAGQLVRTESWGAASEHRVRLTSGLEVELGVADVFWADTDPVDPGTVAVIRDGVDVVFDPDERLRRLIIAADACRGGSAVGGGG